MEIACLDLEGVLVPEIWIELAERTGLDELRATTRDISDYDVLMERRLGLLKRYDLRLSDIAGVIDSISPLEGATEFLAWLRERFQLVILSDTFYEFAQPLMAKLGSPVLFCHNIEADAEGNITGYRLRQRDAKRRAVRAFRALNFRCIAAGDSYNDTGMLLEAEAGTFFRAPERVRREFPTLRAVETYEELSQFFAQSSIRWPFR